MANDDKPAGKTNAPRTLTGAQPPAPPAVDSSAGDLNIPTLGANKPEGNTAEAPAPAAPPEASFTIAQMQALLESTQTATLTAVDRMLAAAEERWARNRPAQITQHLDAISTTPDKTLDIPADRDLDSVNRSDLDMVTADAVNFADHAAELAFLNEEVIINVAESTDPNDQKIFMLSVNGRQVWIERGVNTRLKRYYVEQLFRAKPQKVKVTVGKDRDDNVVNRATKTSALAFPFQILQDRNKLGQAWAQKLMREG